MLGDVGLVSKCSLRDGRVRRYIGKRTREFSGFEEDRVPFFSDAIQAEAVRFPRLQIGRPIAKGVVNHLRKWPSELSTLFVIACLVMSLILVTFVMLIAAILCTPAVKYKWYYSFVTLFVEEKRGKDRRLLIPGGEG